MGQYAQAGTGPQRDQTVQSGGRVQGPGEAPGVAGNAAGVAGQLDEESRLGLGHAVGRGVPVLLRVHESGGDHGIGEGEF